MSMVLRPARKPHWPSGNMLLLLTCLTWHTYTDIHTQTDRQTYRHRDLCSWLVNNCWRSDDVAAFTSYKHTFTILLLCPSLQWHVLPVSSTSSMTAIFSDLLSVFDVFTSHSVQHVVFLVISSSINHSSHHWLSRHSNNSFHVFGMFPSTSYAVFTTSCLVVSSV